MAMNLKKVKAAERIDAWAKRQANDHKRECLADGCAGKTIIWWVTRHPQTDPLIANQTAITFVISQQVCEILEIRLVNRDGLRWLPGEQAAYDARTREQRQILLQRVGRRVDTTVAPTVTKELPQELPPTVRRTNRGKNREVAPEDMEKTESGYLKYPRRETPSGDTLDWVDSLTSRRETF